MSNEAKLGTVPKGHEGRMSEIKIGSMWRHKKKGGLYRLTEIDQKGGWVYLKAETKGPGQRGCRSTWKADCLLTCDYEQVTSP